MPSRLLAITVVAALTGALAGCAPATESSEGESGLIRVVASTNVYGDIATTIGGDLVQVTSILEDPSQDPHSFEANAQVQLELSKADLVIENGGGYDDWAQTLLAGANNPDAVVLDATDISGYDQGGEFNEHVFYDFPTMGKLGDELAENFGTLDPSGKDTFLANAAAFGAALAALEAREATIKSDHGGEGVVITEPVPGYLLDASGLTDVTPSDFSEAIEEGTDVSPAVLAHTLALIADGTAQLLVYNAQTSGPETDRVLAEAKKQGMPTIPVTETLPAGDDYLGWMAANLDAIEKAL